MNLYSNSACFVLSKCKEEADVVSIMSALKVASSALAVANVREMSFLLSQGRAAAKGKAMESVQEFLRSEVLLMFLVLFMHLRNRVLQAYSYSNTLTKVLYTAFVNHKANS